jgi:tetratricopeptide (TPR) repeat protein
VYVGEEDNLTLVLIPDIDPEDAEQHVQSIRKHYQQLFGDESELAVGVAAWPCLDFNKSEIPGNCLKALLHSSYLGHGITVLFDHISLNVSGDFFFDEGDYRAAIREYRRGLRLQPGDLNLMNSLGVALIECGQERKAAICFQEVLAQDSSNYMALVNLGHVQYALGRKDVALARFEQAYGVLGTVNVAAQELLVPLGKLYAEFGEHSKAQAIFEHWHSCPGSENEFLLYRLLAQSYYANGSFEDAIQACQKALRLFPQDSISLSTLGLLYVEQGEGNDIGLNLCQKALALDNFNPDHWYRLGRALLHTGDQAGALSAAKHCLQLQRFHVQGMLLLSRIYSTMKKNKLAERMVMKVLAVPGANASQKNHAQQVLAEIRASSQSN